MSDLCINNNRDFTKFNFENTTEFNMLLINVNSLESLKWSDNDYLDKIINLNLYKLIETIPDNFLNNIVEYLDVNKFNEKSNVMVETQIVAEFPEFIYEIIFLNNIPKEDINKNDLATMLITNGDTIYGNVLLMKTKLPVDNKQMIIINSDTSDIKFILENRINTKIVTFDDEWEEKIVIGSLDDYAKTFFENESYLKYEFPFLSHNINIWYQKLDGGNNVNICGKILEKPIYKCLWFTMISDEYRGSLSLNEVKKIIELSYDLNYPYKPYDEWICEEKDQYDRKVIKNKYRVLEMAFKHFRNSK
jgi:hypothetical protein